MVPKIKKIFRTLQTAELGGGQGEGHSPQLFAADAVSSEFRDHTVTKSFKVTRTATKI